MIRSAIPISLIASIVFCTQLLAQDAVDNQMELDKRLQPNPDLGPISESETSKPRFTRFETGSGDLPTGGGQIWREYDIRPYTARMSSVEKPQKAIVDWILRETGTSIWFHEPSGLLSANESKIRVYHTESIHAKVATIVDRFVSGRNNNLSVQVRLVTLQRVDWRRFAWPMLTPIEVQSPGIEAWLLEKEDATLLLASIRRLADFREHNSRNLLVHSGHSHVIERFWPRVFIQGVQRISDHSYGPKQAQLKEGFSLKISPLVSNDKKTVHAAIKCQVDHVEEMTKLSLDIPSVLGTQRILTEVPQVSSWRIHERFRWPSNRVLLVSRGMVAMPGMKRPGGIPEIRKIVQGGHPRFEALLFLDANTEGQDLTSRKKDLRTGQLNYRGRY